MSKTMGVVDIFSEEDSFPEAFHRTCSDNEHDLFLGNDKEFRRTMLYISTIKPKDVKGTSIIDINIGKRKDDKWVLSFSLKSNEYLEMFNYFCYDIIESMKSISIEKGMMFLCNRYKRWQEMLNNTANNALDYKVLKGLVGELYFIIEYLVKQYSIDECIKAWVGTMGTDQDFVTDTTWYEIKTINIGRNLVNISSIQQLDSKVVGNLIVIYMGETSELNENAITINKIVSRINNMIENEDILIQFNNKLFAIGYWYKMEYDQHFFDVKSVDKYIVNDSFPCIRSSMIPSVVSNVKYQIDISGIQTFKGEL